MSQEHPYCITRPGAAFSGHDRLVRAIRAGAREGELFVIIGGACTGKTSLFRHLETSPQASPAGAEDGALAPKDPPPPDLLIRRVSLDRFYFKTSRPWFKAVYCAMAAPQPPPDDRGWQAQCYVDAGRNFLENLRLLARRLDGGAQGTLAPGWRMLVLLDDLDIAVERLGTAAPEFLSALGRMCAPGPSHDPAAPGNRFSLAVSGKAGMDELAASPLLFPEREPRRKLLGCLSLEGARALMDRYSGFPPPRRKDKLDQLTGFHPFLLHGILEEIAAASLPSTAQNLEAAARAHMSDQPVFPAWYEGIGPHGRAAYYIIATAPGHSAGIPDIRAAMEPGMRGKTEAAIRVLMAHGVIRENQMGDLDMAGTLFRDWFLERIHAGLAQALREIRSIVIDAADPIPGPVQSALSDAERKLRGWKNDPDQTLLDIRPRLDEIIDEMRSLSKEAEAERIAKQARRLLPWIWTARFRKP